MWSVLCSLTALSSVPLLLTPSEPSAAGDGPTAPSVPTPKWKPPDGMTSDHFKEAKVYGDCSEYHACSGHGRCIPEWSKHCTCDFGWKGPDCSIGITHCCKPPNTGSLGSNTCHLKIFDDDVRCLTTSENVCAMKGCAFEPNGGCEHRPKCQYLPGAPEAIKPNFTNTTASAGSDFATGKFNFTKQLEMKDEALDKNLIQYAKKRFDQIDNDGNGVLDREEMEELVSWVYSFINGEDADELQDSAARAAKEQLIMSLDADGDGVINFDEFVDWYSDTILQVTGCKSFSVACFEHHKMKHKHMKKQNKAVQDMMDTKPEVDFVPTPTPFVPTYTPWKAPRPEPEQEQEKDEKEINPIDYGIMGKQKKKPQLDDSASASESKDSWKLLSLLSVFESKIMGN